MNKSLSLGWRCRCVLLTLSCLSLPAWAIDCDSLRSQIEAKIRASGVKEFSVTVLDAQAATDARVVGSCDLGSKKIVYRQISAGSQPSGKAIAPAPAAAAAPPAPPAPQRPMTPAAPKPAEGMITECADGRVLSKGSCS